MSSMSPRIQQRNSVFYAVHIEVLQAGQFSVVRVALTKPGKDYKFPQNLRPITLLPSTGKLFGKDILQIVQKHISEYICLMQVSDLKLKSFFLWLFY
jgi:hypothetical protein